MSELIRNLVIFFDWCDIDVHCRMSLQRYTINIATENNNSVFNYTNNEIEKKKIIHDTTAWIQTCFNKHWYMCIFTIIWFHSNVIKKHDHLWIQYFFTLQFKYSDYYMEIYLYNIVFVLLTPNYPRTLLNGWCDFGILWIFRHFVHFT